MIDEIVAEPVELTEDQLELVSGGTLPNVQSIIQSILQMPGGNPNQSASNVASINQS